MAATGAMLGLKFGDIGIRADGVGGILDSVPKTLRIPFTMLQPNLHTYSFNYSLLGLHNNGTGGQTFHSAVMLPPGVTINTFRVHGYRATLNDEVIGSLWKIADAGNSLTPVASPPDHTTTGWQTMSDSITEVVSASHIYIANVFLNAIATGEDAKVLWCEVAYTSPSYRTVL